MPRVSVIIPTHNRGNFISKAIQSVLRQTYDDYELIVVDDGSTDNTREVVGRYGDHVRYIYQSNKGPSAARNNGIRNAKGTYIAFCDSDDRFLPQKLEKQMSFLKKKPKCKFLYSWYYDVHPSGIIIKKKKPRSCLDLEHFRYSLLTRQFVIRTSTVLMHQEIFQKAGLFNESYWNSEDWDLWLRIAAQYHGYCLKKPLTEYWRYHGDNISSKLPKVHHQEIYHHALKLYGWKEQSLSQLKEKYDEREAS